MPRTDVAISSVGLALVALVARLGFAGQPQTPSPNAFRVQHSDAEWRKRLSPEQYRILRQRGTERAYTGKYWDHHERGVYHCAGCDAPLFSSKAKFDSRTGWPSFFQPIGRNAVLTQVDRSHGMVRDEVLCATCGGHLGHVFDDGPRPTGLRYCINSAALAFKPGKK